MKEVIDTQPKVHPASNDTVQRSVKWRLSMMIGGGVAAAIGAIAMTGWLLVLPALATLGQGLIPMAPSTAVLFMAYGVVSLAVQRTLANRRFRQVCLTVCAAGGLVSFVLLVLSIQGIYLDIEHFGITAMGAVTGTPVGHMSPITAFSFLLVSLLYPAVVSVRPDTTWRAVASWWAAVILIAVYIMLSLAYLFGTPMFYGGAFIPPAATTSLAFIALGIAVASFARPLAWPEDADNNDPGSHYFSQLLIVVFLLLVAGIVAAGYFYHRKHEKHYLTEIERQLTAITDLKVGELELWREERLADASLFYHNAAFAHLVKTIITQPEAGGARRDFEAWVGQLQSNRNYDSILLLDARGGSRLSIPGRIDEHVSPFVRHKALESMSTGRITFTDFYRSDIGDTIYLSILVPLFDPADAGAPLGVMVIRIDPEKYLYPFIRRWPVVNKTAESLLVRREGDSVLFLNPLKFRTNAALNLTIPLARTDVPAVMAVRGQVGVVRGIDYRGSPVLAALSSIPDSPWFFVTRIDAEEVYAPLRARQWVTVLLVGAMLVSAGTGVGFVWRLQSGRFYRERYREQLKRVEIEDRLTKIAANLPGAIFQLQLSPDGDSSLPYVSSGLEVLYGLRPEEVVGDASALYAVIHPEDSEQVTAAILESARTLSVWHNEHRVIHPDRVIWVEGNATPELKSDGSVLLHGFLTDITGRKEKERELEKKNSELERFVYTVSHDLKSPLVTIKTFLGYLEEDLKLPDISRVTQDLGFMHNAADKMSQLLAELLELSRVGRLNNPPQEIAFMDLAREAVQLDAGRISERGVTVEIGDSPLLLIGDHPRLVEIWQNLVENACKFMGNQVTPRIEIGVDESGRDTVFFVRDNGIGINPCFHAKVFGLFEKLDAGADGTGLGLALVKRIVELYDGTVRVESAGEGQGTTVLFTLPGALKR